MFKHEDEPITFTEEDARRIHFPHNDTLVVTVQIRNMKVHRSLIDNRSYVDIMYLNALQKMGIDAKNLQATTTSLYSFTRDNIRPLRII